MVLRDNAHKQSLIRDFLIPLSSVCSADPLTPVANMISTWNGVNRVVGAEVSGLLCVVYFLNYFSCRRSCFCFLKILLDWKLRLCKIVWNTMIFHQSSPTDNVHCWWKGNIIIHRKKEKEVKRDNEAERNYKERRRLKEIESAKE